MADDVLKERPAAASGQHRAIRREYRQQAPRWGTMEISDHLR